MGIMFIFGSSGIFIDAIIREILRYKKPVKELTDDEFGFLLI